MAVDPSSLVTTDVELAAQRLRDGGLVAFATETVYGLGADAADEHAVRRVFAAKGRPPDHPLIVHLADAAQLDDWAVDVPACARRLADACWPGPLTLLLPRHPRVPDVVTGGRPTIGLRIPAHPLAAALLAAFGGGVAAPSANRFGHVSATTAAHVLADLGGVLDPARDVVLDGGATPVGVESTIVDCTTDPPQLLRPGAITAAELETVLGAGSGPGALAPASGPSRAAGMLASHYAPTATVVLVDDVDAARGAATGGRERGMTVRVLDFGGDLGAYAAALYDELRRADDDGVNEIVAVLPPPTGLGLAIRDRLHKAAAPRPADPALRPD